MAISGSSRVDYESYGAVNRISLIANFIDDCDKQSFYCQTMQSILLLCGLTAVIDRPTDLWDNDSLVVKHQSSLRWKGIDGIRIFWNNWWSDRYKFFRTWFHHLMEFFKSDWNLLSGLFPPCEILSSGWISFRRMVRMTHICFFLHISSWLVWRTD